MFFDLLSLDVFDPSFLGQTLGQTEASGLRNQPKPLTTSSQLQIFLAAGDHVGPGHAEVRRRLSGWGWGLMVFNDFKIFLILMVFNDFNGLTCESSGWSWIGPRNRHQVPSSFALAGVVVEHKKSIGIVRRN